MAATPSRCLLSLHPAIHPSSTRPAPPPPASAVKRHKSGLLSQEQRRANHIASEQKRRAAIRQGYDRLGLLVPSLGSPAPPVTLSAHPGTSLRLDSRLPHHSPPNENLAADGLRRDLHGPGGIYSKKKRKAHSQTSAVTSPGPKSEAVVLTKTVEYLRELESERSSLLSRLNRAEEIINRHPWLRSIHFQQADALHQIQVEEREAAGFQKDLRETDTAPVWSRPWEERWSEDLHPFL